MKKRNLNSLKLNKQSISAMTENPIKGGLASSRTQLTICWNASVCYTDCGDVCGDWDLSTPGD